MHGSRRARWRRSCRHCWAPAEAAARRRFPPRLRARTIGAMRNRKLYKVTFHNLGKTYELYARQVSSSALWGYTEVSDLVFESAADAL